MKNIAMDDLSTALKPLMLLERIAALDHPSTLANLAMSTLLANPTLHRWLETLETAGLLQRTPDARRYELSRRASQLAFSILSNMPPSAMKSCRGSLKSSGNRAISPCCMDRR
jgi:DNA-binding IclR family transcriptional regulator